MRGAAFVAAGIVIGFWLDDPADRVRVQTETVTEQVEVSGPTVVRSTPLPETCQSMIDLYLAQVDYLRKYSSGIAPQNRNLNRSQQAIAAKDINLHNEAMTVQYEIEAAVSGPLREIMYQQATLDQLQERCEEDRSSS